MNIRYKFEFLQFDDLKTRLTMIICFNKYLYDLKKILKKS